MAHTDTGAGGAGTPKKRRALKVVGVIAAVLVAGLVVLVALAPRIASGIVPGVVEKQAANHVKGSVVVGGADLSWGGPQRVGPITWKDEAGQTVATVSIETSAGLVGLATGTLDLGTVKVSGAEATIVRETDGTLNVQSLLKQPPTPGPSGAPGPRQPIKLPDGLKLKLALADMAVTFIDKASPTGTTVTATATGEATVDPDQPLKVAFTGKVGQQNGPQSGYSLDLRATNWAASDATVTPEKATLTAKASTEALPVAMLDALVGPVAVDDQGNAVPLARALGPSLAVSIGANGSLQDATAKVHVQAERARADGDIRIADGVLTTASPFVVQVAGTAAGDLVPALGAATRAGAETRLDALPDATLTIENVSVKLPRGGGPLDLRGAAAKVQVALTQIVGQTRLSEGEPVQVMRIAPLTATIQTQDLASGVRITANTSATLANQPAGDLAVDMTASGLIDDRGAIATTTPLLSGTAQVKRISTAIAQPFVEFLQVDLPRDVGPTLDVDVQAASRASATDIDIAATATHLTAAGGFTISPTQVATRSNDFTLTMKRGGGLIAMFVKPETGLRVEPPASGAGDVAVSLRGVSIPRETPHGGSAPVLRLDQMSGNMLVTAAGLRISRVGTDAPPVDLKDIQVRTVVAPGKESTMDIQGTGSHAGAPFSIKGNFAITDLWVKKGDAAPVINTDIQSLRPAGRLQVINLPASAVSLAQAAPTPDAPASLDIAALTREVFGDAVSLDLGIKRTEDTTATEVVARVAGGPSNLVARVRVSPTELKGTENFAKLVISPSVLTAFVRQGRPDLADKLRLAGSTEVQAGIAPFSVPMQGLKPQWDKARPIRATLTVPARATLDGLGTMFEESSPLRAIASAGVESLTIEADVPPAAFMPAAGTEAAVHPITASLRGKARVNNERAVDVSGTLGGEFAAFKPAGPLTADLDLANIATSVVERALGQDALLTSVLGETARVTLKATADQKTGTTTAELTAVAPKLTSEGPIAVRVTPAAFEVTKSAKWRFTLAPEWINQKLSTPAPSAAPSESGQQLKPPAFTVVNPVDVGFTIERLTLPRTTTGTAQPTPKLAAAVQVDIPRIDAVSADNRPATLDNTTLTLTTQESGGPSPQVAFKLNVASARAGDSPAAANIGVAGTIDNLVSPQGGIDPSRASMTASGKMPALPTALVDVLAGQDGLLVEALGPMIALDFDVRSLPLTPGAQQAEGAGSLPDGMLKVHATSDRATLSAEGSIDDAVLTMSEPLSVSILELTDALAGRFVKGLPAIGTIQKSKTDRPAMIVGEGLTIPLSRDFTKLNGVIRIDPGEAHFGTSSLFSQLLDLAKIKTTGTVGQRLEPLTVTIAQGVATYPRYKLPLGEFAVESEGTVDLNARSVDVVTWVPLGSLTDQAAGLFKGNLGIGSLLNEVPVLDAATMVPFRTRGSFDDPKTSADLELFGKNLLQNINPGRLIEKGLDGLFKKKEGK